MLYFPKENLITGPLLLSISDITWDWVTLPELQALPPEQATPSKSKLNNTQYAVILKPEKKVLVLRFVRADEKDNKC